MTTGQAIRAECMWCIGIDKGQRGWDCLSPACPLYRAQPWRGRELPAVIQPEGGTPQEELDRTQAFLESHPPRRGTRPMIADKCRYCMPGTEDKCAIDTCCLFPVSPKRPGGPPKTRKMSPEARKAAADRMRETQARLKKERSTRQQQESGVP